MAFIPWPWKNRGEAEPTAIDRQNLNAAEEALAAQVTSGAIPLPASTVSSSLKELGNVSGIVQLDLSKATVFTATLVGATEFEVINAPTRPIQFMLYVTQDATGGRTWLVKGLSWVGGAEPSFKTTAKLEYAVSLEAIGGVVKGLVGPEGPQGEIGPTGATGAAGATGAKGEEGKSGSVAALTKLAPSVLNGESHRVATISTAVSAAKDARFTMYVIPTSGKLKIWVMNGTTVKGNTRIGVLDTGQSSVGEYTLIEQGEPVAQAGANAYQLAFTGTHVYTAGQVVMIGVMSDSAEATFGAENAGAENSAQEFPEGSINGVAVVAPKIIGHRTYATAEYATLAVANMLVQGTPWAMIVKVV